MDSKTKKTIELEDFAKKYNLRIHPKRSFQQWAWLVTKLDGCPCDRDRSYCPCSQAPDEIMRYGYCLCAFFMTEEHFQKLNRKKNG